MKTRLSNSACDKYLECSLCYKLHYIDGVRPIEKGSALVFGGAIDKALNELLLTRDLHKSLIVFNNEWNTFKNSNTVKYYKTDLDLELVNYFDPLAKDHLEWRSFHFKGQLFIEAYNSQVLPKIKKVIAVQEPITIKNSEGDEIIGSLDLIVEWIDGKIYLLDNKTSKNLYDPNSTKKDQPYGPNSAKESQQLPLYYYAVKDKFKLDGIGYIVLCKTINKNKVKKCKTCGALSNTQHRTCNEIYEIKNLYDICAKGPMGRCNGDFDITINPTVDIAYIFNQVEDSDVDRIIETFDKVNYYISNNIFSDTHTQERGKFGFCPYKEYYEGSPDFIKKGSK